MTWNERYTNFMFANLSLHSSKSRITNTVPQVTWVWIRYIDSISSVISFQYVVFFFILLSIFFSFKEAFESLKEAKLNCDVDSADFLEGFDSITQFNQYILDISDSVWRNRAFSDKEKYFCYSIPR